MVRKAGEIHQIFVTDIFYRIKTAGDEGRKIVLIFPNPMPEYREVSYLINKFRVNCHHVHVFAMDEYASEDGVIAPETWRYGFKYAMYKTFYEPIEQELRPPKGQVIGPSNENINDYGKMIEDMGGADACYSGPGWTGHLAFIEPDAPEFRADLDEWMKMGPRIVTLSPFTLAQNSLHGSFGMSGDIALVPPKAATIGPKEVVQAKYRMDINALTIHGTLTSWQRLITRLVAHGPVTPLIPSSIHQLLRTDFYISEEIARDIEPDWDKGY
jgi:glucosamine-6-phosphate deaminase